MPSPSATGRRIYLDHAAATPVRPEVAEVMAQVTVEAFANPSSPHAAGRLAKRILEESRERILAAAGCRTAAGIGERLVFTSGATEANRLGVLGAAEGRPGIVAGSARDHPGLRQATNDLAQRGWEACEIPLTPSGGLEVTAVETFVAATGPRLLVVTTVCGQTGLADDPASLGRIAAGRPGTRIHADATQAAAWQPLRFSESPFTTLAFAAHKFGGPRGIGCLLVRAGASLEPLIPGPQELGLRGGTESVPLAAGFARAFELAVAEQSAESERLTGLRTRFEEGVIAAAARAGLEARVIGANGPRAPHVSAVGIAGIDRQVLVMAADLDGLGVSSGTACSSGSGEPPAILVALGIDETVRAGMVRASFGRTTTLDDVTTAVERLAAILSRLPRATLLPNQTRW
jgi:cysteine desulfurase